MSLELSLSRTAHMSTLFGCAEAESGYLLSRRHRTCLLVLRGVVLFLEAHGPFPRSSHPLNPPRVSPAWSRPAAQSHRPTISIKACGSRGNRVAHEISPNPLLMVDTQPRRVCWSCGDHPGARAPVSLLRGAQGWGTAPDHAHPARVIRPRAERGGGG